jgi:hypothetical protein
VGEFAFEYDCQDIGFLVVFDFIRHSGHA